VEFYPNVPFDKYAGQHILWEALKEACRDLEGVAFYRYPIRALHNDVGYEPDTLLVLRDFGVFALECKGIKLEQITEVQGHVWYTQDFYADEIMPVAQAEDQSYAVQGRVNQVPSLRNHVRFHARAVLPYISRQQWMVAELPDQYMVWYQDNLRPANLKKTLQQINEKSPQAPLTDEQWVDLKGVFGAKVARVAQVSVSRTTPVDHPRMVLRAVHERLNHLDQTQLTAALICPPGPQRLRGLAGSGKTVILAKRIALLHARQPESDLAFVFHTKSLHDQTKHRITREYQDILGTIAEPNWNKLRVWHAWGGSNSQGFYHHLCQTTGQPFQRFKFGETNFTQVCEELETNLAKLEFAVPETFDAIFIDEGQDLPHAFYRLALASLRAPKRLTWAFDEAQSIDHLNAPEAALVFGRNEVGQPNVDLRGVYEGGALKSLTMRRSYRTSSRVLMAAHAVNMGLFREGGAIQGLTNREDWQAIGYEMLEGDFTRAGHKIKVTRPSSSHAHPFDSDQTLLEQAQNFAPVVSTFTFNDSEKERTFLVASIKADLERGFKPSDLMVVALDDGYTSKRFLDALQVELAALEIKAHVVGDVWHIADSIPLAHIYRAKGNEATRVYACRFEYANKAINDKSEVHARNGAFVAMTRARLWVTVSSGGEASVLEEIKQAVRQYPFLEFNSFTQRSLQRVVDVVRDDP
jgi:superfamily I DNA and RNA helicase